MNLSDNRYSQYALVREMMDAIDVVKGFDAGRTATVADRVRSTGRLFLSGEGSSRIFPAKNAIRKALTWGLDVHVATDGSRQSAQYDLSRFVVFCASNSGRTKEVILLAKKLAREGNTDRYGLTANDGTPLADVCSETFVLNCGWEEAVAATKSAVEQALFYESILWHVAGKTPPAPSATLTAAVEEALTLPVPPEVVDAAAKASTIYFAGYNDGVAEELTLKTNEITRKKSDFLEGTYAVHGIEEVMSPDDIVFVVDPIDEEIGKFQEVLVEGVGLTVVAIANRQTPFTTLRVPDAGDMNPYLYLCAGWNVLVEIGLALGIDLDKPQRARKIGNELIVEG
ncbi:MAG TPA: SIS domain-containing protein [Phycisphaerales bacterium]|nr:SIS domain-containing protein [Phycisphaerales bacterium]